MSPGREGGLSGPRWTRDEKVVPIRRKGHGGAVAPKGQLDEISRASRRAARQVGGHQLLDQFRHAATVRAERAEVGVGLQGWDGVGHRHRTFADRQKRMIVLGVSHADYLVTGEPHGTRAALRPLPLFTPDGNTITASTLKMICSSRPRSRIVSKTTTSCGRLVAKIARPLMTGATPRRLELPAPARVRRAGRAGSTHASTGSTEDHHSPARRSRTVPCGGTPRFQLLQRSPSHHHRPPPRRSKSFERAFYRGAHRPFRIARFRRSRPPSPRSECPVLLPRPPIRRCYLNRQHGFLASTQNWRRRIHLPTQTVAPRPAQRALFAPWWWSCGPKCPGFPAADSRSR